MIVPPAGSKPSVEELDHTIFATIQIRKQSTMLLSSKDLGFSISWNHTLPVSDQKKLVMHLTISVGE